MVGIFECNQCDYTKSPIVQFVKDICNNCGSKLYTKSKLRVHEEFVHGGKKRFKGDLYLRSFDKSDKLKQHKTSAHEGKTSFKCHICQLAFAKKENLKMLMINLL